MQYIDVQELKNPISRIILGCAALGEYDHGVIDRESLKSAVYSALDEGINAFDVADCYGSEFGLAEANLSEILGSRIKELNIITKFGVRWHRSGSGTRPVTTKDISTDWTQTAIENSLKRLKLETIPIYFIHWPDGKTPIEETINTLSKLKKEGKVLHIGLSNFSAYEIERAHKVEPISFVQYSYNLIDRKIENSIIPLCDRLGIKLLCYGALAQGFLTGKYACREDFDKSDHRSRLPHFQGVNEERNRKIISTLKLLAEKYNVNSGQVAIAWCLKRCAIKGVILGAKNAVQVKENADSLGIELNDEDFIHLNNISM